MAWGGRPYETEELFGLRELQGRQRDALPPSERKPTIPSALTGVPARATELALRRAAARIAADSEYLSSYLDRCVNGRGPQLALGLARELDGSRLLTAALMDQLDRPANGQIRQSEVPLTVREELEAWMFAVTAADELARR